MLYIGVKKPLKAENMPNSSVPEPDAATTAGAGVTVNPTEEYENMNLDHFLQSVGFEAD